MITYDFYDFNQLKSVPWKALSFAPLLFFGGLTLTVLFAGIMKQKIL